mmetsp:Transcript_23806/g.33335  ORF Transcript_23806/g.33335 Transcript_23806/m.33335 type:complete len:202 (-) Transcript_23806:318-923(-)
MGSGDSTNGFADHFKDYPLWTFNTLHLRAVFKSLLTIFHNCLSDTLGSWKLDCRIVLAGSNSENVQFASRELVSPLISQVEDGERSRMGFLSYKGSYTPSVSSLGDHAQTSDVEFNYFGDLVFLDIVLDSIENVDLRIRITDRASVVSDNDRDGSSLTGLERIATNSSFLCLHLLDNLEKLVLSFCSVNLLKDKAALGIVQ